MATVSIIMPVYNAEKTLKRCVESILNQEYTDFELLLIDDGSSDLSGSMCDEYAAQDTRVRVLHKENTGVSDTRNCGIQMAEGKYLQFVDADDWITADATKLMVREAVERKCELVISDFYRVVGDRVSHKGSIKEEGLLTREAFAEHMKDNPADFYYGVLWNKLFSRDIIIENGIRMDEKVSWCEDFLFNLEYILHVDHVFVLTVPIYYYMKTEGSLVSQAKSMSHVVRTKLYVFEYYNNFFKNVYDEKEYLKKRPGLYRYLIDAAGDSVVMPGFFSNSTKLGQERVPIAEHAIGGSGYLTDLYRNTKLLDRYYQAIGLRYELTLNDIKILAHLSQIHVMKNRKELADYAGVAVSTSNRILQKLVRKKMIDVTEHKEYLEVCILKEGEPVIKELKNAFSDYDDVRFQGFTEEEIKEYLQLQSRMEENIRKVLNAGRNSDLRE
ncbi:MAG: glycosyltransferase [Lachnospiraceae bacterium]